MALSRRTREKRIKRDEILRAAKVVFAERGFDGAVLDEIAWLAEFSKGAIYGYFKNKEDLFISLIDEELNKLSKITKAVVESSASPIEKIKALVQRSLAFFESNSEFFCIFMPERGGFTKKQHPKIMKKVLPKYLKDIEMVAQIMAEGIKGGVIKDIEPTALTHILLGLIHSTVGRWMMEGGKGSLKLEADIITTIFLDGARR